LPTSNAKYAVAIRRGDPDLPAFRQALRAASNNPAATPAGARARRRRILDNRGALLDWSGEHRPDPACRYALAGRPVAGDRPQALLAALAARDCRPVRPEELIELVWGEDAPSNGMKSLQVLVSRARNACGADAIVRDGVGYRLGAAPGEVDSARLAQLVRTAAAELDRDTAAAE